jgi:hypothetical protein
MQMTGQVECNWVGKSAQLPSRLLCVAANQQAAFCGDLCPEPDGSGLRQRHKRLHVVGYRFNVTPQHGSSLGQQH